MGEILIWRSEWDMNIPDLDAQHHALFDQLNRITMGPDSETKPVEIQQDCRLLLETFLDKIREHFHAEEKLMADVGFPQLAEHHREHAMLTAELQQLIREVSQGTETCSAIAHDIKNWYVSHVAMDGKEFSDFFHTKAHTQITTHAQKVSSAGMR